MGRTKKTRTPMTSTTQINYLFTGLVLLFMMFYLLPLFWVYISALKSNFELIQYPPTLFPKHASFNWHRLIVENNMGRYYLNSLILATGNVALTLALAIGPAYVLSKYNNRWIDFALLLFLILQMLPPALMATPLYLIYSIIGLNDSLLGVICASAAKTVPFSIILLRTGFSSIPKELNSAAVMDNCNRLDILTRIYLPLAKNHIVTVGILLFLQGMGEYAYAKSFLSTEDRMPVTVLLSNFIGTNSTQWDDAMQTSAFYITPLIIIFIFVQRRIMSGLTAGSVKG